MAKFSVSELLPGMCVSADVYSANGKLLMRRGTVLTRNQIYFLKQFRVGKVEIADGKFTGNASFSAKRQEPPRHLSSKNDVYNRFVLDEISAHLPRMIRKLVRQDDTTSHGIREQIEKMIHHIVQDDKVVGYLFKMRTIGDSSFYHSLRVAVLSLAIAIHMKMELSHLKKIGTAALLYDIGKWYIDKRLLLKEGNLTKEEFERMKEHTSIGYAILSKEFDEEVGIVALQHHERYNGSGYPKMIKNDSIHLFSRIVSVGDIYASLINDRSYRKKYLPHEAVEYIYGAGGHLLDPEIVAHFFKVVSLYEIGDLVELNDGSIGIVKEIDGNLIARPIIELLFDEIKTELTDLNVVDLRKKSNLFIVRILEN